MYLKTTLTLVGIERALSKYLEKVIMKIHKSKNQPTFNNKRWLYLQHRSPEPNNTAPPPSPHSPVSTPLPSWRYPCSLAQSILVLFIRFKRAVEKNEPTAQTIIYIYDFECRSLDVKHFTSVLPTSYYYLQIQSFIDFFS